MSLNYKAQTNDFPLDRDFAAGNVCNCSVDIVNQVLVRVWSDGSVVLTSWKCLFRSVSLKDKLLSQGLTIYVSFIEYIASSVMIHNGG